MNKGKTIFFSTLSLVLVLCCCLQSCNTLETDTFQAKRALFFDREVYNPDTRKWDRIDTADISVTHYPGEEKIEYPFRIKLIGDTLPEELEYELIVVDSLTTAKEGMVSFPEKPVFRKGATSDSLWLTVHAGRVEKDGRYCVTLRLVSNGNFDAGYKGYTDVKLWFNNRSSKPVWWNKNIEDVYLGVWSARKFDVFVSATDLTTLEGMSATEKRIQALKVKEYVAENQITEEDNEPMIIPIY